MPSYHDYSISSYGWMLNDERRMPPYVEALTRAIGPETVLLDIGTGTGFFALLAARLGAKRIYAIEPDDAIDVARLCAADNPNAERIRWIQGLSTELELPERVDVVIGDLHGSMPFFKQNVESLKDARLRHLKPGGLMLPCRDLLHVAPATADKEYDTLRKPWEANDYAVDFRAARRFVANTWWKARGEAIAEDVLLGAPTQWGCIDYHSVESSTLRGGAQWTVDRAAPIHGYYIWFDSDLGDGLSITNTPLQDALVYGRAFFPLEQEVLLERGDCIEVKLAAIASDDSHLYTWDTRINAPDGTTKAKFRQSTFNSVPFAHRAREGAETHVPPLAEAGRIDLAILQAMANAQPLGSIAAMLLAQFPGKFPEKAAALNRAARVSRAYSDRRDADAHDRSNRDQVPT